MEQDLNWKFDRNIAMNFVAHAQQHIPNYDNVIDKAVEVCKHTLTPTSSIIDIGCATGETLSRLATAGFTNLVGVDASPDMLSQCHIPARLILSDCLPNEKFDAIICNWTLHFIQNKLQYLTDVYQSLANEGFLFLTDKTSKDPLSIHFYHEYKKSKGVSELEIISKARSVESIMYIDPPLWYLENLKLIGFKNIQIVDASWCFTSFICTK